MLLSAAVRVNRRVQQFAVQEISSVVAGSSGTHLFWWLSMYARITNLTGLIWAKGPALDAIVSANAVIGDLAAEYASDIMETGLVPHHVREFAYALLADESFRNQLWGCEIAQAMAIVDVGCRKELALMSDALANASCLHEVFFWKHFRRVVLDPQVLGGR
jgi:hypothetical protein